MRIGQRPDVIWTRKLGCNLAEDLSFSFFFGDHLNLERKTVSITVKTFFFFLRSPKSGEKNRFDFKKDLFFEITQTSTEKPTQIDRRPIKIWVKIV